MITGPFPKGHWMSHLTPEPYGHLDPGGRYRVVRDFHDYDRDLHPAGEEWFFLGWNFLPYEDGLSLFVSVDGEQEWHIRMQDRGGEQLDILNQLRSYIVEIAPAPIPDLPKRDPDWPTSSF